MLDYHEWREGLLRGLAAHHAGMLPIFRHTVEELFTAGLVKAVFATETLALGINMPARTVVLERLVKFNGEQHMPLTPGEYTQLTGRAGRRGIDVEGHAVVLWHPDVEPAEVAGLASTRTFPLRSSFAPSYNMTINLVHQMGPTQAHQLLERSFAQYQADRSVVGLVRGRRRAANGCSTRSPPNSAAATRRSSTTRGCARQISERERAQSRASRLQRRKAANDALAALRRGDIITITHGRRGGLAVVLEAGRDGDDPRPLVLTEHRWAGRISSADYSGRVGADRARCRCPNASNTATRGCGAISRRRCDRRRPDWTCRRPRASAAAPPKTRRRPRTGRRCASNCAATPPTTCRTAKPRSASPSATCASNATTQQIQQKVAAATNSLARTFDRIVVLLTERGFIDGDDGDPKVTDDGRLLARIYSESDLLVAECLRSGTWNGLDAGRTGGGAVGRALRVARRRAGRARGRRRADRQAATRAEPDPQNLDRAARRRAAAPHHRRAANPTTVSSPPSIAGPPPAT